MKRILKLTLCVLLVAALLAGCGIDSIPMPDLPKLSLGSSELTAVVENVNGRTLRIRITEGDSHFDQDDILQLTFTALEGEKTVAVGNRIHFSYDYTSQVSELLGSPHISVEQIHVG